MFLINTPATLGAFGVIIVIFTYLKRRHLRTTWGDLRRGFWLSVIRRSLLQMERFPDHPKNWRPNIMVVTGIPQGRLDLVELADWLGGRRGLVTLHHVLVGPYRKMSARRRMAMNNLSRFIQTERMNALPAVDVVEDRASDLGKILTSQGFGSFRPNTVMLDWAERCELKRGEFEKLCKGVIMADKTLLTLRVDPDRRFRKRKRIDIWPPEDLAYMPTLLILGYLISQNEEWAGSGITVHLVGNETDPERYEKIRETLRESRIPVTEERHDNRTWSDPFEGDDASVRRMIGSDLLIAPFPSDSLDGDLMVESLDRVEGGIARLPSTLLVRGPGLSSLPE